MSNKYTPHLIVIPEDDANRQIVNGFLLDPALNPRAIQVEHLAKGWIKGMNQLIDEESKLLRQYPARRVLLIIDFDGQSDRLQTVQKQIPDELKERVFVLGTLTEPEKLKTRIPGIHTFEKIGEALARDCSEGTEKVWGHELLRHNRAELYRMSVDVKPFLFH